MKTPISNSGVKQQKDILSLLSEWHELLRHAKSKYSFRGRFDADEFNRCIKGAYHYFVTPDGRIAASGSDWMLNIETAAKKL